MSRSNSKILTSLAINRHRRCNGRRSKDRGCWAAVEARGWSGRGECAGGYRYGCVAGDTAVWRCGDEGDDTG